MSRTIVIGDLHGALKALKQLMEKLNLQSGDTLIFLGDYVDGWSESAQLIEYLMETETRFPCVFIKGNHDAWAEAWLRTGLAEPAEWVRNGGSQTMASYADFNSGQKARQLSFFEKMVYYYLDQDNRLFVHAGFTSQQGPLKELFKEMFYWDRTLWETALSMDEKMPPESVFYPKRLKLFREIYIGHTPTTNFGVDIPMHACGIWNVDTGAAFRGRIAAMDIETKEYWQSDPIWKLYPGEKGRNK